MYRWRARANVGTQVEPSFRVSQPTWSACRCVCTTVSMPSGAKPASAKRSRNGQLFSFQNGIARFLPLPTHGSTSTRRPRPSITNACTRRITRPLASTNSGTTQACLATCSGVTPGKNSSGGIRAISSSTTLVSV